MLQTFKNKCCTSCNKNFTDLAYKHNVVNICNSLGFMSLISVTHYDYLSTLEYTII